MQKFNMKVKSSTNTSEQFQPSQSSPQNKITMEEILTHFLTTITSSRKNTETSIKEITTNIGNMINKIMDLKEEQCKVVITRSGRGNKKEK